MPQIKATCRGNYLFHLTVCISASMEVRADNLRQDPTDRNRCQDHGGVLITIFTHIPCLACFLMNPEPAAQNGTAHS